MPYNPSNPFVPDPDYWDRKLTGMWITAQGEEFVTHGFHDSDPMGLQGVYNAKGQVKGLWDAPVKTTWKTGAFLDGSEQKAVKVLHRDLDLGFHIIENGYGPAELNESRFRMSFTYEDDPYEDDPEPCTIHVETEMSGERKIDVLLYDAPKFEPEIDPIMQQYFNTILPLRAGDPMWYEDEDMSFFEAGTTSASGFIVVANPTDQIMRQRWVLTNAIWTLPDFSWKGGRGNRSPSGVHATRTVVTPQLTSGGVLSLNRKDLKARDFNYTNILGSFGGKLLQYTIPPYTQEQALPISYTSAPAGGARAELWQPRRWSRPWGLEL